MISDYNCFKHRQKECRSESSGWEKKNVKTEFYRRKDFHRVFFAKNLKILGMKEFEQPGEIKNFINQSLCLNYKMRFFSLPKAE